LRSKLGIPGAADDFHALPLDGQCGHLAVAMMRDQDLDLIGRATNEGREKVFARMTGRSGLASA